MGDDLRCRAHTGRRGPAARGPSRPLAVLLALGALAGAIASGAGVEALAGETPTRARLARALAAADTAHLRLVRASGSSLYETGRASGTLPGSMRAWLEIGARFSGTFTIYTSGGTIRGHGSATPRGSGRYETFRGSLHVLGGSGRYAHVHGTGGLNGTFDRRTDSVVVQTTGELAY